MLSSAVIVVQSQFNWTAIVLQNLIKYIIFIEKKEYTLVRGYLHLLSVLLLFILIAISTLNSRFFEKEKKKSSCRYSGALFLEIPRFLLPQKEENQFSHQGKVNILELL
ncbi:hypothetical protein F4703DRAFT_1918235 [Phycomyces blakesleeanus]